jgi:transposase
VLSVLVEEVVVVLCAALDIHKHVFQGVVLDPETGEMRDERFAATREDLCGWASQLIGVSSVVAVEATTGWRWVVRELTGLGLDVRLAEPGEARALRGRRRKAKTDRIDARWLALLLAREMLPEAWIPPAEIQQLRDLTRMRMMVAADRSRWAQRLHALLVHEGWPCARSRLLTATGRRWVRALALDTHASGQVTRMLRMIEHSEQELAEIDDQLRAVAASDARCLALQELYGIGPIIATTLLAEIGDARRFRRAAQITRLAGLDPVVDESADSRRRGHLAKAGSPQLRWALVEAAIHATRVEHPDHELHRRVSRRAGRGPARMTAARKIGRRVYHVLRELELAEAA